MSIFSKLAASFSESRQELKKTSTLTCTALMLGVSLLVSTFTIVLNPYMKIGFSTVPIAIVGALFGPFVGGLAGGLRFQYYPMLLSGPVTPLTVSFFAVYGLLCFTPVLLDALSRRRYLVRKGGTPHA